ADSESVPASTATSLEAGHGAPCRPAWEGRGCRARLQRRRLRLSPRHGRRSYRRGARSRCSEDEPSWRRLLAERQVEVEELDRVKERRADSIEKAVRLFETARPWEARRCSPCFSSAANALGAVTHNRGEFLEFVAVLPPTFPAEAVRS